MHQEKTSDGRALKRILVCHSWQGSIMSRGYLVTAGETNPNHFLFLGESAKFGGSILTILVSTGMTELKHNPMIMLNFR